MKNLVSLKNMVKTVAIFVGMGLGFVLTSCNKEEDGLGAANAQDQKASLVITEKEEPTPVLSDSIHWHFRGDSLVVICDSLKDHVIFKSDSTAIGYTLEVKREFDERQTASTRLEYPNLGFTFADAINKQNGKMEYVGSQTGSDDDGQSYTINLTSGKIMNWHGLNGVHFVLNGTKLNRFDNKELTPKANESTRVESTMKWEPELGVAGLKNPEGKTLVAKRETKHERFILKNAPKLIGHKNWKVWKETGNWNTLWHFSCEEIWSNDSVAPKSKMTTLKGTYSRKNLDDKTVSNLADYTHPEGTLVWGDWYGVKSKDTGVTLREKKGTKKSLATNGFDADEFNTEFSVTMQEADVMFCDSLFHVSSDEATLTNQRNVFLDEDSDRDGYQMVRFTDTEVAKWAGQYDQKLDETCKLYLKLKEPEIIDYILVDGSDYKTRTENSVKVGLTIKPKYDDGTFGKEIPFAMERAESWVWLKDSVIYENVDFFMQETAEKLELVGDLKKTAKTQRDNGGVFSFNEYEGDFRTKVTSNGMTKYTTWHATWSEDFTFTYTDENGKTFSHTFNKSDYNVKAQNASLKKNESKSSVTSEIYDYSVDGIFAIDNVNRSAYGYGRFQKAIAEKVIKEYWSTEKSAWTEYGINSYYKVKIIREYNTGKKTEQEFTYKHIGSKSGSSFELTAQSTEHVVGAPEENVSLKRDQSEKISDMVSFNYDLMKLDYKCQVNFDGAPEKTDIFHFEVLHGVNFSFVDVNGETQVISFDDFNRSFTNNVKSLTVKSENESETQYNYINEGAFTYGGTTANVNCLGLIHVAKSSPVTPDFDIEVGSIFANVCRPSNRNGVDGDITAYAYLLVSEDGKKCLPLGIYHGVVTVGDITDMEAGFNSACYEKNVNKVVPTRCELVDGIIQYYRHATGDDAVDAGMFMKWQAAGFNNRGNSFENWQHKYEPKATKKGNVTVVTFEGTNVSYTFRGWNVQ